MTMMVAEFNDTGVEGTTGKKDESMDLKNV
jgi:hypothetical protein